MKPAGICLALALLLAPCAVSIAAAEEPKAAPTADQLFQAGKFAEAGALYAAMAARHPDDYAAILGLGRIALLANRLGDAEAWLGKAIALKPGEEDAKVMLAEALLPPVTISRARRRRSTASMSATTN